MEPELENGYGGIPGWIDDEVCLFQAYDGSAPTSIDPYDESEVN